MPIKTISAIKKKKPLNKWQVKAVFIPAIKALRTEAGLTLKELSSHTVVPLSSLQKIEAGGDCKLSHGLRLAEFFEKSITEIFSFKEKK